MNLPVGDTRIYGRQHDVLKYIWSSVTQLLRMTSEVTGNIFILLLNLLFNRHVSELETDLMSLRSLRNNSNVDDGNSGVKKAVGEIVI